MTRYIVVPGWGGSSPAHWQSHWERELPGATRIAMTNWFDPHLAHWLLAIERAVHEADEPPTFVAHSLGCIAVLHWAKRSKSRIRSAFLVAPVDVEAAPPDLPLENFGPVPRTRLPFPSRVVASDNDPLASVEQVSRLAAAWGSELTVLRRAEHINVAAGFGPWSEGKALLEGENPWICRGVD